MKTKDKSVSSITFVFNEELYIKELIYSILNQSIQVDQIIIIDDFSTDATYSILTKLQNKYRQIEIYRNKIKGKVNALKYGLEFIKSNYFFITAGDDYLLKNYVLEMLNVINRNEVNICYAKYIMADQNLENKKVLLRKIFYSKEDILKKNWVGGYFFAKASISQEINSYLKDYEFEDWAISLSAALKYGGLHLSKDPIFLYRRHDKSSTQNNLLKDQLNLYKREINFIQKFINYNLLTDSDKMILDKKNDVNKIYIFNFNQTLRVLISKTLSLKEKLTSLKGTLFLRIKYAKDKE